MKKLIVVLGIAFVAISSQAAYLFWQVDSTYTVGNTEYTVGADYNAAKLHASYNGSSSVYDYISAPGSNNADLTSLGENYKDATYWVELVNYDDSTGTASTKVESLGNFTYAQLSGAFNTGALSVANMTALWNGAQVMATPEPTSGLLTLLGMALLGLKRKKA